MNRTHLPRRALTVFGALLVALTALQIGAKSRTEDWPQFRGPNRDGISRETGLRSSWPEDGPKELWRVALGEGYSGISIVGDRIYTMDAADNDGTPTEFAVAFDAKSGSELWRRPVGEKYDTQFGNGPRSTPTLDGETVYVLGSKGDFAALNTGDGEQRWGFNLIEKFGTNQPYWGFSTSAVVEGDLLIFEGGGPEGKSYIGANKKTGEVAWTVGDAPAGYNSPLPVDMHGKRSFVYVAGEKLMSIDADGKEIWSHPWPQGETHAMPVFIPPDRIFASGAEGVGATLLEIPKSGGEAKELWKTRFMRNHFSSSVLHGDHIYGFDNATLKCISVKDGELAWAKRGLGKGSLILAGDRLFVLSDRGKLVLVEATPEAYVEKGSVQALDGRCWTAPTLSRGRLYLRSHTEMVAYDVKD
ncbi:MAG: PQQ-binding-like beta-propeller repeat protein [bacterium]|nr:PQQ-binding-like beta-propeller repeat protein [bacterium]